LFLNEREGDEFFDDFVDQNQQEIFGLFDQFQIEENYFAKRQGLKTLYMLLVKYEKLRITFTSNQDKLK
jgi:hypothetical protein